MRGSAALGKATQSLSALRWRTMPDVLLIEK
jgi:hypothetical protein